MQLTYAETLYANQPALEGEETFRIPLGNLLTASLISVGLWTLIWWAVSSLVV